MARRLFAVVVALVACAVLFVLPASAAGRYPSYAVFDDMYNALPSEYDSHAIVIDDEYGYVLCSWDASITKMTVNWHSGISQYVFYPHRDTRDTGVGHFYYWNGSVREWVHFKDIRYSLGVPSDWTYYSADDFIYTSVEIPPNTSINGTAVPYGVHSAVNLPVWHSLEWENYKGFSASLISEIVGILPVVVCFLAMELAIHKGVSFLLSIIRSA